MDQENKTVGVEIKVPECLDEATKNLVNPLSISVGKSMSDIWDIVFGGLGEFAERKRLMHAYKIEQFKAELNKKIEDIPPEKLVLPDTQVVAGALDDARFCVEKDDLREMFSNLIAASLHADTAEKVHPSFSNIIRHLSPFDAHILIRFKDKHQMPIVHFVWSLKTGGTVPVYKNVISATASGEDIQRESQALLILQSLGLIDLDFNRHFVGDNKYKNLLSNPLYAALVDKDESFFPSASNIAGIDCLKGIASLTDLGSQFLSVCL